MNDGQESTASRSSREDKNRGRYAPSPTGPLHLGNLRTAFFAWLQTRASDGVFVMRMEDLDRPRTVEGSAQQILDDLKTLGIDWDEGPGVGGDFGPYTQSERDTFYEDALEKLRAKGLIYPCFCSRKEIAEASSAPHGKTLVYPGTCSRLTAEERTERHARTGRNPAFRFRAPEKTITFDDRVRGQTSQHLPTDVGDFVVKRSDGLYAYQLAVVVDDILMEISHVLRGDDLLDSTPRQIALYEALNAAPPEFWHVPLMHDDQGSRMSKRDGSMSLRELLEKQTVSEIIAVFARSLGMMTEGTISCTDVLEWARGEDLSVRFREAL